MVSLAPDSPHATDGPRARGLTPAEWLVFLAVVLGSGLLGPLRALAVFAWAWRSRTPFAALGFVRPLRWLTDVALAVLFGAAFKLAMKAVVMPLLGAPPVNEAYRHVTGHPEVLPGMVFVILLGAGLGEEIVFRGFAFERLGRAFGGGTQAKVAIVLLTSLGFGLAHLPEQGLPGFQQSLTVGLVLGAVFASTGRLWFPIAAHAAFNLTALALIYWDLERDVAGWFFR